VHLQPNGHNRKGTFVKVGTMLNVREPALARWRRAHPDRVMSFSDFVCGHPLGYASGRANGYLYGQSQDGDINLTDPALRKPRLQIDAYVQRYLARHAGSDQRPTRASRWWSRCRPRWPLPTGSTSASGTATRANTSLRLLGEVDVLIGRTVHPVRGVRRKTKASKRRIPMSGCSGCEQRSGSGVGNPCRTSLVTRGWIGTPTGLPISDWSPCMP
jgi:hypothetical protein